MIKGIHKGFIYILIVLVETFILEVEEGCKLPTLVIAPEEVNR
jgi:hypothetical protein